MRRALIALGLTFAFAVPSAAHAADDTAPPVVVTASLSPTAVDVSESPQQVQATLRRSKTRCRSSRRTATS